ncbi:outer membrane protein assembly factor BamB family protein [Adhaeretor mobilis]|uniref:Outer membrane biogenesis protein BamB n=1 Tax=Adhaeretor mobilis TaxID=1930276 RepID=A0A517MXB1_9BACT|nr:PQQ-binding-like beta-propeller repeat protein [Adhaeretor mobilis]QDS99447.1 outer membrane biogenesis protein BamB [Adhaeretor mobilis]
MHFRLRCRFYVYVLACCLLTGPVLRAENGATRDTVSSTASEPGDWPRWRGPRFDGISTETDWSHDWPESGPPQLWTAEVGIGFSSFSVADGKLYTMGSVEIESFEVEEAAAASDSAESDPDNVKGKKRKRSPPREDIIWQLDATKGDVLWKHTYPAKLINRLHEGGPAATPTIHDGLGYTVSKEGHFVCFDIENGEPQWTKDLAVELGVKMPNWGFSGSALIVEELVIVEAGRTAAFDRTTGAPVWQTDAFRPGYSSPVKFTHPESGKTLVASLNNDFLLIVNAHNGHEVARAPFKTSHPTNSCTPIITGDTLFLSSGYNRGCTLLQLKDGELARIYDNRNMRNHMNSCVLHEGSLFGFDGNTHSRRNGTIRCIDHATGELRWKERGYGIGSLLLAGERIIALSDEGELLVLKPTPEKFELLASCQVIQGKCWTPPVLCEGLLYVRNATGKLICIDLRK